MMFISLLLVSIELVTVANQEQINETSTKIPAAWNYGWKSNPRIPPKSPKPKWIVGQSKENKTQVKTILDLWLRDLDDSGLTSFEFVRYSYDKNTCRWRNPSDHRLAAESISTGLIQIDADRNTMLETMRVYDFQRPPAKNETHPVYQLRRNASAREKWLRIGNKVWEFDFEYRKIFSMVCANHEINFGWMSVPVPPFPFCLHHGSDEIFETFWMRFVQSENNENEFWLQGVAKSPAAISGANVFELHFERSDGKIRPKYLYLKSHAFDRDSRYVIFEYKNHKVQSSATKLKNPEFSSLSQWELVKKPSIGLLTN